jgi:ParB family chromosome partitioning protein
MPKIIEVELTKLRPNPDQPRKVFAEQTIKELADSIDQHGLIQPISIVPDPENQDGYMIVAGERRYRAHQHLTKPTIVAIITKGKPDEISLIENIQREDLNPMDQAEGLASNGFFKITGGASLHQGLSEANLAQHFLLTDPARHEPRLRDLGS